MPLTPDVAKRAIEELLNRIRHKCLDCCAGSVREVKLCQLIECPLHQLREPRSDNFDLATILNAEIKNKSRFKFLENYESKNYNIS